MRIYRYLYYNLFCIWLKKKDERGNAQINAIMSLTFLIYLNIMTIILIFVTSNNKDLGMMIEEKINPKLCIIVFLIGLGLINYIFLSNKVFILRMQVNLGSRTTNKEEKD